MSDSEGPASAAPAAAAAGAAPLPVLVRPRAAGSSAAAAQVAGASPNELLAEVCWMQYNADERQQELQLDLNQLIFSWVVKLQPDGASPRSFPIMAYGQHVFALAAVTLAPGNQHVQLQLNDDCAMVVMSASKLVDQIVVATDMLRRNDGRRFLINPTAATFKWHNQNWAIPSCLYALIARVEAGGSSSNVSTVWNVHNGGQSIRGDHNKQSGSDAKGDVHIVYRGHGGWFNSNNVTVAIVAVAAGVGVLGKMLVDSMFKLKTDSVVKVPVNVNVPTPWSK